MSIENLYEEIASSSALTGFWAITNGGFPYEIENSPYEIILKSAIRGVPESAYLYVERNPCANTQCICTTENDYYKDAIISCATYPHDIVFAVSDVVR